MKGIVFNLLEIVVCDAYGEETWDALLARAGLEGAYTSLGSYPDNDLEKLVTAASRVLDQPGEKIVRWFGRHALPVLAQRFPEFFAPHGSTRSFLLTLNDVIHPEVRKLYPGAEVPHFDFDARQPDRLVMSYHSTRRLCAFGEGLIEGAAAHYHEEVLIEQSECVLRGDQRCVLDIRLEARRE